MIIHHHPPLHWFWMIYKKIVVFVLIVSLLLFIMKDFYNYDIDGNDDASDKAAMADEILLLKSQVNFLRSRLSRAGRPVDSVSLSRPTIYVITPTHRRAIQKAHMTRLCQTFIMVPNLHWIVIEDSEEKSPLVMNFLENCGVPYTHLNIATPQYMKTVDSFQDDELLYKPKGVLQRNLGLRWIRKNRSGMDEEGVIYFADDDNTYSIELFEEMRYTKKVSVWPVGLNGGLMVEKPHLDPETKKVVSWDVDWFPTRPFAIDMAGFAVNLRLLISTPMARFSSRSRQGLLESEFLSYLVTIDELEPKADECTKVLVWHTRTEHVRLYFEDKRKKNHVPPSNINVEV